MLIREHGDELTDDQLVWIAGLRSVAGHETTSNMLGLGTLALLRRPGELALVRDAPGCHRPRRAGATALVVGSAPRYSAVRHGR